MLSSVAYCAGVSADDGGGDEATQFRLRLARWPILMPHAQSAIMATYDALLTGRSDASLHC